MPARWIMCSPSKQSTLHILHSKSYFSLKTFYTAERSSKRLLPSQHNMLSILWDSCAFQFHRGTSMMQRTSGAARDEPKRYSTAGAWWANETILSIQKTIRSNFSRLSGNSKTPLKQIGLHRAFRSQWNCCHEQHVPHLHKRTLENIEIHRPQALELWGDKFGHRAATMSFRFLICSAIYLTETK